MNQLRHSTSIVKTTKTRPVFVGFTSMVLWAVAGVEPGSAKIINDAIATGLYNGQPVNSNTASVGVDVTPAGPALVVTKTASPDADVAAGTLVTYTYTVQNTGNQIVTDITLNDVHSGSGPPPIPGNESLTTDAGSLNDSSDGTANDGEWSSLAPGDVITLTATYTITQSDVDTQQ
jgi:uncharacterized repeat protein (TIGR01451 family)